MILGARCRACAGSGVEQRLRVAVFGARSEFSADGNLLGRDFAAELVFNGVKRTQHRITDVCEWGHGGDNDAAFWGAPGTVLRSDVGGVGDAVA